MKNSILTLTLLLAANIMIAQGNYEKGISTGIEMLKKCNSTESANNCSNYFERVAEANKNEWLPLYYAAYASLSSGFYEKDPAKKDELFLRGISFIDRAKSVEANESEIIAIEAYLRLMYISNDAMKRAPSQTGEAIGLLEQAKELDPSNPRPWFVHGQNTFYTPEFFGGGVKNAKPLLEKADALYKSFKPKNELMPVWGNERCNKLLEECGK